MVVLKAGKSKLGSQISISHTGSLAGTDEAFQALFDQLAMIRVESPVEMMETLKFLSVSGAPRRNRLAAFTCSGGDAALVADYCEKIGLDLVQPSATAAARLAALLPDIATVANPLDYTTPLWGNAAVLPEVFTTMMADDYDVALVIQDFPPGHIHADNSYYRNDAASFIKACSAVAIPGAVCSDLPENIDRESREILINGGVAPLQGLDAGLDAIANACRYGAIRDRLLKATAPVEFGIIETPASVSVARIVDEWQGKQRLLQFGIQVPAGRMIAVDANDAVLETLDYPLVLKAISSELPHKSEAGAVQTNLQNPVQLRAAIDTMRKSVARAAPGVEIRQFLVESMIDDCIAELMVGINTDPQFGQLLVIASGGVLVELTRDARTLLLPASDDQIDVALRALKCFKLLQGFRGRPAADIDQVIACIRRLIDFAANRHASLLEMDINPLMITPQGCVAADVMLREAESQAASQ